MNRTDFTETKIQGNNEIGMSLFTTIKLQHGEQEAPPAAS